MNMNELHYDFSALPFGEQFVLWTLRCLLPGEGRPQGLQSVVHEAYARIEAEQAFLAINRVATLLAVSCRRPMHVGCPRCRGVGEDELLFLGLMAELQRGNARSATMGIAVWFAPAAVRLVLPALEQYAQELRTRRIVLRSWDQVQRLPLLATPARFARVERQHVH
jgi:hypothetical protein